MSKQNLPPGSRYKGNRKRLQSYEELVEKRKSMPGKSPEVEAETRVSKRPPFTPQTPQEAEKAGQLKLPL